MRAGVMEYLSARLPVTAIWAEQKGPPPERPYMTITPIGVQMMPDGYAAQHNYGIEISAVSYDDNDDYDLTINGELVSVNSGTGGEEALIEALRDGADAITGVDVLQENATSFTFYSPAGMDQPTVTASNNLSILARYIHVLPIVIGFQVCAFTLSPTANDVASMEAVSLLAQARACFELDSCIEALNNVGLGFFEISADRHLSYRLGGTREQHFSFDVHLHALQRSSEAIDFIESFDSTTAVNIELSA